MVIFIYNNICSFNIIFAMIKRDTPQKNKSEIRLDLIYQILNLILDSSLEFEVKSYGSFKKYFDKEKREKAKDMKFVFTQIGNKWKVSRIL